MRHALPLRTVTVVAATAALWLALPTQTRANTQATNTTATIANSAEAALAGQSLRGQSLYRYWGFEVYVATLYTEPDFAAARFEQQRFALELQYRRAFKGSDIAQRSIDEMQGIAPLTPPQATGWKAAMERLFPDVRPGDRLMGEYRPGSGGRFFLNGRPLGGIDDPVLAARFFGIWLSPRTSAPQLREALITGSAR
ncbi:MAG: chalcone isomerase family protein [Gemmobacter sp.]|nr:chalcone isomerase family protein [Gemmobacter sp.]